MSKDLKSPGQMAELRISGVGAQPVQGPKSGAHGMCLRNGRQSTVDGEDELEEE